MTITTGLPKVTHNARIDPTQFWRQNWQYGFHLHIPDSAYNQVVPHLQAGFTSKQAGLYYAIEALMEDVFTVQIPYMQEIDVIRPAAVFITNLLEGGKHVEDRGRTSQTYTISGGSGFLAAAPHPANKTHPFTQEIKDLTSVFVDSKSGTLKELGQRSGYGWFHRFAGIFEAYWSIKRGVPPKAANQVKLIWVSERDDDVWVVVPTSFRWRRSSRQNFQYSWSVTFEIIEDFHSANINPFQDQMGADRFDPLAEISACQSNILKLLSSLQAIATKCHDFVRKYVSATVQLLQAGLALINGVQNTVASGLSTIGGIISAFTELANEVADTLATYALASESPVVNAFNEVLVLSADSFFRLDAAFSRLGGDSQETRRRTEAVRYSGMPGVSGDYAFGTQVQEIELLSESADPINYAETDPDQIGSSVYGSGLPGYISGFVSTPPQESPDYNTFRIAYLQPNDTIYSVAKRELGLDSRFHEIILENDLDPPFIVPKYHDTSYQGRVLRIGDPIKIPTTKPLGTTQAKTEQVVSLTQGRTPQANGFVSAGSSKRRLLDGVRNVSGKKWSENQWVGYTLTILEGTGVGESAIVLRSDEFSLYFYLQGNLRYGISSGVSSLTLKEGHAKDFPTTGRLILSPGLGAEEEVYITGITDDVVTFTPPTTNPHAENALVYQEDQILTTTPDTTSQYILWLQEETTPQTRNTTDMAFGVDYKLEKNPDTGLWDMVEGPDGDVALVTGFDAYVQSLAWVMSHGIGANPLSPEDGVPKILGRKLTANLLTLYMMYVRRVIFADPRTLDVVTESITVSGGDVVAVQFTILVLGGSEVHVGFGDIAPVGA